MISLAVELEIPSAENVIITDDTLSVDLSDGRTISVPIAWYPRLSHAEDNERKNWMLIDTPSAFKRSGLHGIFYSP